MDGNYGKCDSDGHSGGWCWNMDKNTKIHVGGAFKETEMIKDTSGFTGFMEPDEKESKRQQLLMTEY